MMAMQECLIQRQTNTKKNASESALTEPTHTSTSSKLFDGVCEILEGPSLDRYTKITLMATEESLTQQLQDRAMDYNKRLVILSKALEKPSLKRETRANVLVAKKFSEEMLQMATKTPTNAPIPDTEDLNKRLSIVCKLLANSSLDSDTKAKMLNKKETLIQQLQTALKMESSTTGPVAAVDTAPSSSRTATPPVTASATVSTATHFPLPPSPASTHTPIKSALPTSTMTPHKEEKTTAATIAAAALVAVSAAGSVSQSQGHGEVTAEEQKGATEQTPRSASVVPAVATSSATTAFGCLFAILFFFFFFFL